MSDWKRWRDDPDAPDDLRALFAGGSAPRGMTAEERARARARATAIVGAGAAGFFAASAWARTVASGKLIGAAAFVTVATAATMAVASRDRAPVGPAHALVAAGSTHALVSAFSPRDRTRPTPPPRFDPPSMSATSAIGVEATNAAEPLPASAPEHAISGTVTTHSVRAVHQSVALAPHTRAADPETDVDPLVRESELVQEAMRSIRRDPAHALQLAARHAREFPNGQLAAETAYVRVRALARLGRMDEALREARALIEAHPESEYAARLSRALESSGGLR